jgi:hypothetical protein
VRGDDGEYTLGASAAGEYTLGDEENVRGDEKP